MMLCRTASSAAAPSATARFRPAAQLSGRRSRASVSPVCSTSTENEAAGSSPSTTTSLGKELNRFTRQAAGTFAPRSSVAVKNPAYRGSTLYWVFEAQAWLFLVVGGLLSFNVLFPTDEPSIPRLLGMWSIWMMTIPSLRAKECMPKEKDALNVLFLLIPIVNVLLPFVWKSFAFIFVADVVVLGGVYTWKGVWEELYLPLLRQGLANGLPESILVKDAVASQTASEQAAIEEQK